MSSSKGHAGIETAIGRVLRYGVVVSSVVIALGVILAPSGLGSNDSCPTTLEEVCASNYGRPTTNFGSIFGGILSMNSLSIIETGVLVLFCVPFFRVAASALMFAYEKDWMYVAIACFVLVVLLFSTFVVAPYEAGR